MAVLCVQRVQAITLATFCTIYSILGCKTRSVCVCLGVGNVLSIMTEKSFYRLFTYLWFSCLSVALVLALTMCGIGQKNVPWFFMNKHHDSQRNTRNADVLLCVYTVTLQFVFMLERMCPITFNHANCGKFYHCLQLLHVA